MADGLKFSLTVIFPDNPGNMTSIAPILTSFQDFRVCFTENGLTVVELHHETMEPGESRLLALELWDLIKELVPLFTDSQTAEFAAHNKLVDITGNMNLKLEFEQES